MIEDFGNSFRSQIAPPEFSPSLTDYVRPPAGLIPRAERRPCRAAQSHRADRLDAQRQDVPPRHRTAGLRFGRRGGHSGRDRARDIGARRHRGDRFLRASARRLPNRRQTRLNQRRLNSTLARHPKASANRCADPVARLKPRAIGAVFPVSSAQRRTISRAASSRAASRQTTIESCTRKTAPCQGTGRIATCFRSFGFELQGHCSAFSSWRARIRYTQTLALPAHE
jgi:hypothetical protein